jgi:phospholipid/cholesterol/gamma-HCH transport system permease protein
MPRFYAGTIMLPILVIFSDLVAILGSYVIAVSVHNITPAMYIEGLRMFFKTTDVLTGLLKAFFFGMIITTVASYYGFTTSGGAEGVGKATTGAVVTSSVLILIMDYIIASIAF